MPVRLGLEVVVPWVWVMLVVRCKVVVDDFVEVFEVVEEEVEVKVFDEVDAVEETLVVADEVLLLDVEVVVVVPDPCSTVNRKTSFS